MKPEPWMKDFKSWHEWRGLTLYRCHSFKINDGDWIACGGTDRVLTLNPLHWPRDITDWWFFRSLQ